MAERPAGPTEVRPNTLQGQSIPNTFRSDTTGPASRQYLNSGGGNSAPPTRLAIPVFQIRAIVIFVIVAIVIAVVLLDGQP